MHLCFCFFRYRNVFLFFLAFTSLLPIAHCAIALAAPLFTNSYGNTPQTGGAWVTVLGLNFGSHHQVSIPEHDRYNYAGYQYRWQDPYAVVSRSNIIAVTRSSSGWNNWDSRSDTLMGTPILANALVNGIYDDHVMYPIGTVSSGTWVKFEFGMAAVVVGFKSYNQPASWGGTWELQASNNDFTSSTTLWSGDPDAAEEHQGEIEFSNVQSFRYYRFIGRDGVTPYLTSLYNNPYLHEIEFVMLQRFCQTASWSSSSALHCHTVPRATVSNQFAQITVAELVGSGQEAFHDYD